jgi:hypothetical protein
VKQRAVGGGGGDGVEEGSQAGASSRDGVGDWGGFWCLLQYIGSPSGLSPAHWQPSSAGPAKQQCSLVAHPS